MSSKFCSKCVQKLPLSSFLKDTLASPSSRVYSTCIRCRSQKKASNKKRALQPLDLNIQHIQPMKRVRHSNTDLQPTRPQPTRPQPTIQAPLPLNPPEPQPQAPVLALTEAIETGLNPEP
jgi:hypothetical protein